MPDTLARLEEQNRIIMKSLKTIEGKLDELLYEEDRADYQEQLAPGAKSHEYINSAEVMRLGDSMPYRRFEGVDADRLRAFITYILDNPEMFTAVENRYASYANKPFDDLRLSSNSYRILNGAHRRVYNRDMPFKYVNGILYKYGEQLHWTWNIPEERK